MELWLLVNNGFVFGVVWKVQFWVAAGNSNYLNLSFEFLLALFGGDSGR